MKLITILALSLASVSFAADEVKIEGEAKCGKCALQKSEKCHTVVVTKDSAGNEQVYWLKENDKDQDKAIHSEICKRHQANHRLGRGRGELRRNKDDQGDQVRVQEVEAGTAAVEQ